MAGLKLKINLPPNANRPPLATPGSATPVTATPGGTTKPKFKFTTSSTASTPAPPEVSPKPKKTKAGRAPKPSSKLVESRKRVKDESENDDQDTIQVQPITKRIKLNFTNSKPESVPKTPGGVVLKAKVKGKAPKRPAGEGYDSEASDREIDPTIEEQFVLRMMPGDDCDYLRQAINEKRIGLSKHQGGADVNMKFFHAEGRRAAITIRGRVYAATLVDLPCVIEGMKSWDRRGWWKSADICQMLWVYAQVKDEAEAKVAPLPQIVNPTTFQYPHGLTPPMQFARSRRFRKRLHKSQIEAVEDAVEALLRADEQAESTTCEFIDPDADDRRASHPYGGSSPGYDDGDQYSEDEDADGDLDEPQYFDQQHNHTNGYTNGYGNDESLTNDADMQAELEADLAADLEADLEADFQAELEAAETPASNSIATPSMPNNLGGDEEAESDDESIDEDDEDDEDGGVDEISEEERARQADLQGKREDIAELEKSIAEKQANLASQPNAILRMRIEDTIRKIRSELEMKKAALSALGEDEDNE